MFCDGLVVPTPWLEKVSELGDTVALVWVPVPVRLLLCDPFEVLSDTVTVAVRLPDAAGVKVTVIEQLAPTATVDPQLLDWE
jgi:hypothetical protein